MKVAWLTLMASFQLILGADVVATLSEMVSRVYVMDGLKRCSRSIDSSGGPFCWDALRYTTVSWQYGCHSCDTMFRSRLVAFSIGSKMMVMLMEKVPRMSPCHRAADNNG